jgi:hypothetical protein
MSLSRRLRDSAGSCDGVVPNRSVWGAFALDVDDAQISKRRKIAVVGDQCVRTDCKRACSLNRIRELQFEGGAQGAGVIAGRLWSSIGPNATFLAGAAFALVSGCGLFAAAGWPRKPDLVRRQRFLCPRGFNSIFDDALSGSLRSVRR